MKYKSAVCLIAAMLTFTPVSSAFAYDNNHWGHGGPLVGLIALGTLAAVGTVAILTAPFAAAAAPVPAAYYPPQPGYYAPTPQAYYARPVYYAPQAYYAPAPAYYAPPSYYYGR